MEILEAFDLAGSLRGAAELAGCDHKTVAHWVAARESAGGGLPLSVRPRPAVVHFRRRSRNSSSARAGRSVPTERTRVSSRWAMWTPSARPVARSLRRSGAGASSTRARPARHHQVARRTLLSGGLHDPRRPDRRDRHPRRSCPSRPTRPGGAGCMTIRCDQARPPRALLGAHGKKGYDSESCTEHH